MYKIKRGLEPEMFTVECYHYIHEAKFHTLLYSMSNLPWEAVEKALQGRLITDNDELKWAYDILRLTNCDALINDQGDLHAIPVKVRSVVKHTVTLEN